MKKLKTFLLLNQKYTYLVFAFFIIYSLIFTAINRKSKIDINETTFLGKVVSIKEDERKKTYLIKCQDTKEKLLVYSYNKEKESISLGDIILASGNLKIPNNNTVFNLFNYKKYLYNQKIFYILNAKNITKVKNNTNIFLYYKKCLQEYIRGKKASEYLNVFILSKKDEIADEVLTSYQKNGLSHLFSISGMHLTIILGSILKILDKVSYNRYFKYFLLIIILLIYMFLTDFTPSILRSGIMFILLAINKVFNFKIANKNIIMLTFVVIILINPFYIYNMGFQLSYVISFYLIVFSHKINKVKNYFIKLFITSLIAFLVSFPIIINNYFEINILAIIINILLVPIISYVVLPLCFFCLVLPLDEVLIFFMNIIENISLFFSNINFLQIVLAKPNFILIIVYYITISLTLMKIKYVFCFFIVFSFHYFKIYLNSSFGLITLDVGQGDSLLLLYPHNMGSVLIDTGGNYNYEISKNTIIPFLKSKGITKLNYLVLTHGDFDHMGGSINLVENFKVEKVIFNCGEFNELEQDLIEILDKKKIPYYSCIKELNIEDNKLYFLNNKDYGNENDNSSVIYTELNNHKFLFMGDAGVEVEEDLIEKYNLHDIDVLKVGHHGSKTSSSNNFINEINPKYSIISVGKNNKYGHPNNNVLNNLKDSKIYRTDQDGSVMFKIKNNKLQIETCRP